MILHPSEQLKFESYGKNPPHALLLVAPIGSGKQAVLESLAQNILGGHSAGRLFAISPDQDKKHISIESIRDLKASLKLSSAKMRVALIPNANLMTIEAQNSLLKMLEEPPKNVTFLLSAPSKDQLLETIVSRTQVWQLKLPSVNQLQAEFSTYESADVARALAIAGGRVGLVQALLEESDTSHPLLIGISQAKDILQEQKFERLCRVEALAKDAQATNTLLEALELTVKAGLESAARAENKPAMTEWRRKLQAITTARTYFAHSVQSKLLLGNLFIRL